MRLKEANLECPNNLKFVPMDFTKDLSLEKLISMGFDLNKKTVFSMLEVTYYLTKEVIQQLLNILFKDLPKGSSIVFDFADENLFAEQGIYHRVEKTVQLAQDSGEPMKFATSLFELENLLAEEQLIIYEHLSPQDIQKQFFQIEMIICKLLKLFTIYTQ